MLPIGEISRLRTITLHQQPIIPKKQAKHKGGQLSASGLSMIDEKFTQQYQPCDSYALLKSDRVASGGECIVQSSDQPFKLDQEGGSEEIKGQSNLGVSGRRQRN